MTTPTAPTRRQTVEPLLLFIGLMAAWLVLQIWVLPKMGIRT
jgi:hypothetical protein